MAGKTDRFCLAGRRCACFVPADGVRGTAFLCGWNMEPMLPAIAEALPHTLLFFAEADGGRDFTPWPAPSVRPGDAFSGGGADYLRFLTETAAPYLRAQYRAPADPARRAVLGYSLGGLFALWALCETDFFGCAASVSGSLWYPGFAPYLQGRLPRPAQAVYLSLGDREPLGGPALMRTVGTATEAAAALLRQNGRRVLLEWNRGGHEKGVESRWKKAAAWAASALYGENGPAARKEEHNETADPV